MLERKIAYNTVVSAGTRIFGLVLSLITVGLITRYLGLVNFGYYSTVLVFLYFFSVLADWGLYNVCVTEISRPQADENKIVGNIFTLRFLSGFFIFALSPLASYFFPYPAFVKIGIFVAALGFWFDACQSVLIGVFQKHLKMEKVALSEIGRRLVQLALIGLSIKYNLGFLAIVVAYSGAELVNFVLIYFFSRKYVSVSFEFDLEIWKKLLKKSLPLGVAAVFTMFSFKLDAIMLSLLKTASEVGIYNLAYKILESLLFFPTMFVGLFVPFLSGYALTDKRKFISSVQSPLDVLMLVIVPLIIGTWFFSRDIILLIVGSDFEASAVVLNILIVAVGFYGLAILFSRALISLEKQKQLLIVHALGAGFNLVANLIFIPRYSYFGAAATTVFSILFELILMLLFFRHSTKTLPSFTLLGVCLLAGLVMATAAYLLSGLWWVLGATLSVILYLMIVYFLGGLKKKDILALMRN